jgi:hypothetical protein
MAHNFAPKIAHVYTHVHEPILVTTTTRGHRFQICEFTWNRMRYLVREQTLVNKAMRGSSPVWLFSVLTDSGSYQIRLDTSTLQWWLEDVYSEYQH